MPFAFVRYPEKIMAATLLWALLFSLPAWADECRSAYLKATFCDSDRNLIADSPADKSKWIDPDPLVLADVPTSDLANRAELAAPFLRHLERVTGRRVTYFNARNYMDLLASFRANRAHIVNLNSGSVEESVRCDGYVPLAQAIDTSGKIAAARSEFIVPANSSIHALKDIKGRKMTFVDEKSNSGYKAPRFEIKKETGLEAGRDFEVDFSGRQDNSVMGIANGLYDVAVVGSDIRERLAREKMYDPRSIRVIYSFGQFPQSPWGVSHQLHPTLIAAIRSAFVTYTGPPNALHAGGRYKAANYMEDWRYMRELAVRSGTLKTCDNSH